MISLSTIKDLCKQRGITLKGLSDCIGVKPPTMQSYFKTGNMPLDKLEKVAKSLNVPVGYFFGESQVLEIIIRALENDKKRIDNTVAAFEQAKEVYNQLNEDNSPTLQKRFNELLTKQLEGVKNNAYLHFLMSVTDSDLQSLVDYNFTTFDCAKFILFIKEHLQNFENEFELTFTKEKKFG